MIFGVIGTDIKLNFTVQKTPAVILPQVSFVFGERQSSMSVSFDTVVPRTSAILNKVFSEGQK